MTRTKHLNKPFSQFDLLTAKLFALTKGLYQQARELTKKMLIRKWTGCLMEGTGRQVKRKGGYYNAHGIYWDN